MITTPPDVPDADSGPCLIITRGLPGSGKTTWALQQLACRPGGTLVRLNRDDLRRMLHGAARWNRESEDQVSLVQHGAIGMFLLLGKSVIVDDTNLDSRTVDFLQDIAHGMDRGFRVQDFRDVPLEVCVQRDRGRTGDRHVGEHVIRDMHTRYLTDLSVKERP